MSNSLILPFMLPCRVAALLGSSAQPLAEEACAGSEHGAVSTLLSFVTSETQASAPDACACVATYYRGHHLYSHVHKPGIDIHHSYQPIDHSSLWNFIPPLLYRSLSLFVIDSHQFSFIVTSVQLPSNSFICRHFEVRCDRERQSGRV
ncbi:hypothetical protein EDB19DRAFT_726873 [Suillus lakei]|nr:hypothetical protein EDB19DRAFT_726873 [Suillus lakei]